nr:PIN domain-containing protein [Salinibacter ruber]
MFCSRGLRRKAPAPRLVSSSKPLNSRSWTFLPAERLLDECERNLSEVAPEEPVLGALRQSFREVVARAVEVVDDPASLSSIPETDPKDVIHITSAVSHDCDFLVTYNVSDYPRSHEGTTVAEPGTLVKRIREQIRDLD